MIDGLAVVRWLATMRWQTETGGTATAVCCVVTQSNGYFYRVVVAGHIMHLCA
jgi:hypothetical protein